MENKAITVEEHRCEAIKNIDWVGVQKIKPQNDTAEKWFLRFSSNINEILYCPYCGKNLLGSDNNE